MRRPNRPGRRGLITILVLVCLLLIAMLSGALLKLAKARRDLFRAEQARLQAEWLVESGLHRAVAKLSSAPDYRGERWEVGQEELGGGAGLVLIEVEPDASLTAGRRVRVAAEYPRGAERPARHHRELFWEGPAKAGKSQ